MEQTALFDAELIRRYDQSGPRYTSFPTAVQFHEGFGSRAYAQHALTSNASDPPRPLSLYLHIPFCATVCFYCACNKVVTANRDRAAPYLERLKREIALQGALFDADRSVDQLHWGGGTPTFLNTDQMTDLMQTTSQYFRLRDDDRGEYSIEIDPREAGPETIALLRGIGFNRLSLGVQDFDPRVQAAVNRIQSPDQTLTVLRAARDHGFKSVNMDLIYGLPFQTAESFEQTLNAVVEAGPDRLSVFNYAHLPHRFKTQRQIREEDLPPPAEKLAILQMTIQRLGDAGYVYIGMDHFARPDDELAVAQRELKLHRNFQGYSTHAGCDLVAMGSTAISSIGDCYAQNSRTLDAYYEHLDANELAVSRGVQLTEDDLLRRAVIGELVCHFQVDFDPIAQRFGIDFEGRFASELAALEPLQEDGLLSRTSHGIQVTPRGRLLIRNICMMFDPYLSRDTLKSTYSRMI